MGLYGQLTSKQQPTKAPPRTPIPIPWSQQPGGTPAPSPAYPNNRIPQGQQDEFVDFWGGDSGRFRDILARGYGNIYAGDTLPSQFEISRGLGSVNRTAAYARAGQSLAGASLNELLANRGKADPMAMNLLLAQTGRENEGNQAALRDRIARAGLGQSGIGVATAGAVDAAGSNRAAGIRAQDLAAAEERRRGDINLATSFYTDPLMQALGIGHGVQTQNSALDAQKGNQDLQMYAALLGAIGGIVCWVARAVYGEGDPRWLKAREYMLTQAPPELLRAYITHGPALAERVKRDPALRESLRPTFDWMVSQAGG